MPDETAPLSPSPRYARLTLFAIGAALLVYLAGNASVPLWDRDEPRYAQCSRQMLETGDWVLPRYLGELRMAKPPLIYWLQAASMSAFDVNEFAARLPSAAGAAVTLALVAFAVRRELGPGHAFWATFVLGTSALTIIAAKACLTDAVLLLFVTGGQVCLYRVWTGRGDWVTALALAACVGLALLVKGPVALGVLGMTLVGLWLVRLSLRWRPTEGPTADAAPQGALPAGRRNTPAAVVKVLVAAAVVVAICVPWVVMVERRWAALPAAERERAVARGDARKGGRRAAPAPQTQAATTPAAPREIKGYIQTTLDHEVFQRTARGQEGHWGPPGYYLVSIWPTFMPWSLILPLTLVLAWQRRHAPHVRFALAAVVGPWLMFEIVQTKLPHYLLPCFPPLAVLAADAILRCLRRESDALVERQFVIGALCWGVILTVLGVAPWAAARWFRPLPWGVLALVTVAGVAYAVAVCTLFARRRPRAALLVMGWGQMGIAVVLFAVYLPNMEFLRVAPRTADLLRREGATKLGDAIMLDYKEPSLAFYQGGTIREHSATVVTPTLLATTPARWLVVTREVWDASPPESRAALEVVGTTRGLDVADGMRVVEVMVVRKKG